MLMESWNGTDNIPLLDASGSTVAMVDAATGNIATNYTYDPLGSAAVTGSGYQTAYQFQGMENDAWAYYKPGRYYSPLMGRPLSSTGPLTAPGGYDSGLAGVVSASMPGSVGAGVSGSTAAGVGVGVFAADLAVTLPFQIGTDATAIGIAGSVLPPAAVAAVFAELGVDILDDLGIFGGGHPYIDPFTRFKLTYPGGSPQVLGALIGMDQQWAPDQRPSAGGVMSVGKIDGSNGLCEAELSNCLRSATSQNKTCVQHISESAVLLSLACVPICGASTVGFPACLPPCLDAAGSAGVAGLVACNGIALGGRAECIVQYME